MRTSARSRSMAALARPALAPQPHCRGWHAEGGRERRAAQRRRCRTERSTCSRGTLRGSTRRRHGPSGCSGRSPPASRACEAAPTRGASWDAVLEGIREWAEYWGNGLTESPGIGVGSARREGSQPPASAPGLGSPLPQLRRDWAHPCLICAGTELTPATSAPGLSWTRFKHRRHELYRPMAAPPRPKINCAHRLWSCCRPRRSFAPGMQVSL